MTDPNPNVQVAGTSVRDDAAPYNSAHSDDAKAKAREEQARREGALRNLGLMMVVGLIFSAIFAGFSSPPRSSIAGSVAIAVLLSACSAFIGGLVGFLFGVPRSLQDGQDRLRLSRYSSNTNLEQISDWLTKILVGVGLTQLREIPAALSELCEHLGPALNDDQGAKVFVGAVMLFFAVGGFLYGYLWTRLFLVLFFNQTDQLTELQKVVDRQVKLQVEQVREESSNNVAVLTSKLDDLEAQSELNARALTLVARQLNEQDGLPPALAAELKMSLAQASHLTKLMAFNEARNQRMATWRNDADKQRMELTIPIFEALIAADDGQEFHMTHAELGYALKDKREPDWDRAEKELSRAITLRGFADDYGGDYYQFNRAICRIHLDSAFSRGERSDPEIRSQIEGDLRVVKRGRTAWLLRDSNIILKWLALNGIPESALESVS